MSVLNGAAVLLAAGGTGGHIMPALAVAEELSARGARVSFVTTPALVERVGRAVPGVPARACAASSGVSGRAREHDARCGSWPPRRRGRGACSSAVRPARRGRRRRLRERAGRRSRRHARRIAGACARGRLRISASPIACCGPFVRRICLSFPIAGLEPPKYVVTGRPLAARPGATPHARTGSPPSASRPTCPSCWSSAAVRARRRSTAPASRRSRGPISSCRSCTSAGRATSTRRAPSCERRGAPVERYKLRGLY